MNALIAEFTKQVILKLNSNKLGAYFWYQAEWGTCYIRFNDVNIKTILVGKGIKNEMYDFKYNLRLDIKNFMKVENKKLGLTYHFPFDQADRLVSQVLLDTKIKKIF